MLVGMSSYATDTPSPDCITPPTCKENESLNNACECVEDPPIDPPPGDDLPIDKNLILLGFVAVSFGSYTIYKKHKPIKKASN